MQRQFTASVWQEDAWYVARCLEVDVVSQGASEAEALDNLREALELYFEPPTPTMLTRLTDEHMARAAVPATALTVRRMWRRT